MLSFLVFLILTAPTTSTPPHFFTYYPTSEPLRSEEENYGFDARYVVPPLRPGSRYAHGLTSLNKDIYFYGGVYDNPTRGDLWRYDVSGHVWTHLPPTSQTDGESFHGSLGSPTFPGSRYHHGFGSTPIGGTSSSGRIRLIGGRGYNIGVDPVGELSDVWDYDVGSEIWIYRDVWSGSESWVDLQSDKFASPIRPCSRSKFAHWVVNGDSYIYGGQSPSGTIVDMEFMWLFSDLGTNWLDLSNGASDIPSDRKNPSYWTSLSGSGDSTSRLFLFGGYDGTNFFNDLFVYLLSIHQWIELMSPVTHHADTSASGGHPGGRYGTASVVVDETFHHAMEGSGMDYALLMGGKGFPTIQDGENVGTLSDVWRVNFGWAYEADKLFELVPITDGGNELVRSAPGSWSGPNIYPPARRLFMAARSGSVVMYSAGYGVTSRRGEIWRMELPCTTGWYGTLDCDITDCHGTPSNDPSVCSYPNGTCIGPNNCSCVAGFAGDTCQYTICHGKSTENPSEVCSSPNGSCIAPDTCYCDLDFVGSECESLLACAGVPWWHSDVCSRNGSCVALDQCNCVDDDLYTGPNCDQAVCHGAAGSGVCNGHGTCVVSDVCLCDSGYEGSNCTDYRCDDVGNNLVSEVASVCSGRGRCYTPDGPCVCTTAPYQGSNCDLFPCEDGFLTNDTLNMCSGHGSCSEPGGVCDYCEALWGGQYCSVYRCEDGEFRDDADVVCSGHGSCSEANGTCECDEFEPWGGDLCNTFKCADGYLVTNASYVCSGHGFCTMVNGFCTCYGNYSGPYCSGQGTVNPGDPDPDPPSGSPLSAGAVAAVVVSLSVLLFALIVAVVVFVVCLICVKRHSEEKIDVVMRTMSLEPVKKNDPNRANVSINESLFEISYSSLKIIEKIGSGGSNSVVFRAEWIHQEVAFKCFVLDDFTREDRFELFEKEVTLLGSLSHPNILRFFGATIAPPRIGIVMEYCKHGDIADYIMLVGDVPTQMRLQFLCGTASGMEFLHSKRVLHRDLKPENVLLTETLDPKICDFGLSRVVESINETKTRGIGTSFYMAPELFGLIGLGSILPVSIKTVGKYGLPVDVFAFGVMAFVLLTSNWKPYGNAVHPEIRVATDPNFRPSTEDQDWDEAEWCVDLMKRCWAHVCRDS